MAGGNGRATNACTTIRQGRNSTTGGVIYFDELSERVERRSADCILNREIAKQVAGKPQKLEIRGTHLTKPVNPADGPSRSLGPGAYDRCYNAMQFLIEQGIDPERIRLGSAGPYEPLDMGLDPEERKRNARVEVLMWDERVMSPSGWTSEVWGKSSDRGQFPTYDWSCGHADRHRRPKCVQPVGMNSPIRHGRRRSTSRLPKQPKKGPGIIGLGEGSRLHHGHCTGRGRRRLDACTLGTGCRIDRAQTGRRRAGRTGRRRPPTRRSCQAEGAMLAGKDTLEVDLGRYNVTRDTTPKTTRL